MWYNNQVLYLTVYLPEMCFAAAATVLQTVSAVSENGTSNIKPSDICAGSDADRLSQYRTCIRSVSALGY